MSKVLFRWMEMNPHMTNCSRTYSNFINYFLFSNISDWIYQKAPMFSSGLFAKRMSIAFFNWGLLAIAAHTRVTNNVCPDRAVNTAELP